MIVDAGTDKVRLKIQGWINAYSDGSSGLYPSEASALAGKNKAKLHVATVFVAECAPENDELPAAIGYRP